MIKIAYLHRLTFEESERRFKKEAEKLGVELVFIKYRQLRLVNNNIFFKDIDLATFDLWYFRAVGTELEWAKLLEIYAKEKHVPVVDEYLLHHGPLRRFKSVMGIQLDKAGVNYPKTSMVESFEDLRAAIKKCQLPAIVKLSQGGRHGMGTFWIKSQNDLVELNEKLKERKELAKQEGKITPIFRGFLIQKHIPNDGDYRVFVVGNSCLGGFKRQPKEEKIIMNKSLGKSTKLEKVPNDIAETAVRASLALEVEIAGVDLVRDNRNGKVYVIEINEAPQFKVFEKRTGINVAGKILEYLIEKANSEHPKTI